MKSLSDKWYICVMILCAGMGGMLYGYDIGVISGALLFIHHSIAMTTSQTGIIVGAVLSGSLVGSLITGSLADRFGRRTMILISCVIFSLGIGQILLAQSFSSLLSARLLLGLAVGMVSVTVPLYLTESAPAAIRGRSVSIFQLFLTFGIVLAYVVDLAFTPSGNWRAMFAMILIPTALLFITMCLLPETPRWLFANKKEKQALAVLKRTHKPYEIKAEVAEIQSQLAKEQGGWRELFSKNLAWPLFVALFIAICNQLTGVNCILQYAPIVLKKAGFSSHLLMMGGTVGIGTINFITTLIAIGLIDKVGRKQLLAFGTLLLVVTDLFLAVIAHHAHLNAMDGWLFLSGLIVYIFAYAMGPGVVVWLAISELLPTKVRGRAVALCLFANSAAAAVLASTFMELIQSIGLSNTFSLFACFTFCYWLMAKYGLPETKGKTLEQIQTEFAT